MSLRFVFAALSATLAPIGAEAELAVVELRTVAERGVAGPEWAERPLGTTPDAGDLQVRGPDSVAPRALLPYRDPRGIGPAGQAHFGVLGRTHLTRCGHAAARLDLPPPPLG
jgi:hypothetical protein